MNRKRFIAGAICPRCSNMDSIYVYQQDGDEYRACSDCDFEEKADFTNARANNAVEKELPTRDVDIQTVKIIGNDAE